MPGQHLRVDVFSQAPQQRRGALNVGEQEREGLHAHSVEGRPGGVPASSLREQLRAALARAGLADPEVTVDAVAALPRNPQTGKLRRVIPA